MIIKNQVFDLVQSMSQTEKRYFKIYAGKYGQNKKSSYHKLFEAIEKMKRYDEEKIRSLFKSEKFIKRLAVEKNNLYVLVLKSLENYHSESSVKVRVKHLLIEVELLYNKSLYEQCERLLKKAEKFADNYQLLEICKWRKLLWNSIGIRPKFETVIETESSVLNEIFNEHQLHAIYTSLRQLFETHGYQHRKPEVAEQVNNLMNSPILLSEKNAISNTAKQTFHNIHAVVALSNGNHNKAYRHYTATLKLMGTKFGSPYHLESYMAIKYNCLLCLIHIDKDKVLQELSDFRKIPSSKLIEANLKVKRFILSSYELELSFLGKLFHFEQVKTLIQSIELFIKENKIIMGMVRFTNTCYYASYLFFILGNYKSSIKWMMEIEENLDDSEIPNHFKSAVRMLNLFIQYELKNKDFLIYLERSVNRFLDTKEVLYQTEKAILKFFRQSLNGNMDEKMLTKDLQKFKAELLSIFKDPFEASFAQHFDVISWINAKMENKSFADIIRRKERKE